MHALHNQSLTALLLVPLVFKPAKVLTFSVSELKARVPNMWLEQLSPQGGSLSLCNPPPFLCLLLGTQVDLIASLPFLPDFVDLS